MVHLSSEVESVFGKNGLKQGVLSCKWKVRLYVYLREGACMELIGLYGK